MTPDTINRQLATVRDPEGDLRARVDALQQLSGGGDRSLAPRLRELWNRQRSSGPPAVNWDPAAAERVVDLQLILALHKLGDSSLVSQIAPLVGRAEALLKGPYSEFKNAAQVLSEVRYLWVLQQVAGLGTEGAVRTLQLLNVPNPPTGGPLDSFPQLAQPVSFTIQRLSEELRSIAQLSNGLVVLSYGVEEMLRTGDYERGNVQRNSSLAQILTQDLDLLNLAYAATRNGVVICTFAEAAARWQQLWPEYSKTLATSGWHA
jgi:hypothetical protein